MSSQSHFSVSSLPSALISVRDIRLTHESLKTSLEVLLSSEFLLTLASIDRHPLLLFSTT